MDSTGAASVSRMLMQGVREMKLAKDIGAFPSLFDLKSFDRLFHGTNQVHLGHNRSKTVGEVSRKNAHPFMFDDILGAHNGTIDYMNKGRLERGVDFKTDSEAIFNNIQVHGIADTIGKIEESEAYALAWYDRRDNTLNFTRNKHRPLVYCTVNKGKTIFWASTYEILTAAIGSEGMEPDDKVWLVTADEHWSWVIPEFSTTAFGEPKRDKLKNFVTTYKNNNSYNANNYTNTYKKNTGYGNWEDGCYEDCAGYLPFIPKVDTNTTTHLHNNTTTANEIISNCKAVVMSKIEETKVSTSTILTPGEVLKKARWDRGTELGVAMVPRDKFHLYCENSDLKVYRETANGMWNWFEWNLDRKEWDKHITVTHPVKMPFHILDIMSGGSHKFKHEGKGKHKRIYYKGFNSSLLNQEQFGKFMLEGCLECRRTPEWGHEVVFVNDEHWFLCEYCSLTPGAIEEWKTLENRKSVG